jgi:hypothetical protein
MPKNPFRQKGGLDNPFTWIGFAIIGVGILVAADIMYVLTHVHFR